MERNLFGKLEGWKNKKKENLSLFRGPDRLGKLGL